MAPPAPADLPSGRASWIPHLVEAAVVATRAERRGPGDRRRTGPVTATSGPVPVHRRTIEIEAVELDGSLEVTARLQDRRPWADGSTSPEVLHEMALRVTVRMQDLVVTEASADMSSYPHAECAAIEPAFADLVGMSVARGYTRAVQDRFGGVRGCTHLEHLARALGPGIVQSVASVRARRRVPGSGDAFGEGVPWMRDTCHVWAAGGIGERKLAAGWRPGMGAYPAPPLDDVGVEYRAGTADGDVVGGLADDPG